MNISTATADAGGSDSRIFDTLVRAGLGTKGAVYILTGVLALMTAFGFGGVLGGSKSAVRTVESWPFGEVLLAVIGVGLAAYALWRFVQAAIDPEQKGSGAKGLAKRLGYAGSGLAYGALAVAVIQMALASLRSGGGSGSGKETYVAWALSQPWGAWLVGAVGVGIVAAGLVQLYQAYTTSFRKKMKLDHMSRTERRWATHAGSAGLSARGVIFVIMGQFLIQAAIEHDPTEVRGVGGALREIASQPWGRGMLIVISAGLVAYGIYMFVLAWYRKVPRRPAP